MHFQDIRIAGPSAVIEGRGDYLLATRSLDFTARLKPYKETHNPLTQAISIVIDPIASLFELKLTGPLAKPEWSATLGSAPNAPKPGAATPTPENPGQPAATPPATPTPTPAPATPEKQ